MARVIHYGPDNQVNFPVSGGGSAVVRGALLRKGSTPATMNGHLRLAASTNLDDVLGILQEAHATADDTDVAGTIFKTHPCDLVMPYRVVRLEYSMAAADRIAATQAVTTTTITLTNLEDDIDAAFLYVVAGTGAGQTNYLTAAAAGSATLKAAFGTNLDQTSRLIKILPRFHTLANLTSDGTKLTSQAAAGTGRVIVLDSWLVRNNNEVQLNPVSHAALTKLNSLTSLRFEADVVIADTLIYQLA